MTSTSLSVVLHVVPMLMSALTSISLRHSLTKVTGTISTCASYSSMLPFRTVAVIVQHSLSCCLRGAAIVRVHSVYVMVYLLPDRLVVEYLFSSMLACYRHTRLPV